MDEKDLEYFGYPRPLNELELVGRVIDELKSPVDLVSDFSPVIGDVKSAGLAIDDLINGDYGSAALNAIGLLPFVPGLGSVIKSSKYADELEGLAHELTRTEKAKRAEELAGLLYDADEIPPGWYVHGRGGSQQLRDDAPIQLTQDWDVAKQYGRGGSMFLVSPNPESTIYDFSSQNSNDIRGLSSKAIRGEGYDDKLSEIVEAIAATRGRTVDEITPRMIGEGVRYEFAPENIVDSAQAFDNFDWLEWLASVSPGGWDTFVHTPDGAVALDPGALRAIKVPREPEW